MSMSKWSASELDKTKKISVQNFRPITKIIYLQYVAYKNTTLGHLSMAVPSILGRRVSPEVKAHTGNGRWLLKIHAKGGTRSWLNIAATAEEINQGIPNSVRRLNYNITS